MTEELQEEHRLQELAKNRFVILIISTIATALLLVMISLALYNWSGAAQVDLSRPGYSAVREQAREDSSDFKPFPGIGPIDDGALTAFRELYDKTAHQATDEHSFGKDVLSDAALRISEEPAAISNQ